MSGGPYGRGKAPERTCMPVDCWPEADMEIWERACAPGDFFDDDAGARQGYSRISNRKTEKGYGRWLTFLRHHDAASLALTPADRITSELARRYVERLFELDNSTATILTRLQELRDAAKVFGPERDWNFLNALASNVRARHKPARSKLHLRLSDELFDLGMHLIHKAQNFEGVEAAVLHRDGLMIAFLALVPLRRSNLAEMRIGANLVEENGTWLILFEESETKTHTVYEAILPALLMDHLGTYLAIHRPILAVQTGRWSKPVDDALWVSSHGSAMTQMAFYDRVRRHTREAFGVAINPHLFRDAAATTLAIADPGRVRVAAPLLGHRNLSTTERYYQQARTYEAHAVYIDALFGKGQS